MRFRKLTAVLAALAVLAVIPAVAGASLTSELNAGSKVEQAATRHWPAYDFVANCSQQSRNSYWCDVIGDHGSCFVQGHATVKSSRYYWTVWLRGMNRSCY